MELISLSMDHLLLGIWYGVGKALSYTEHGEAYVTRLSCFR